MKMLFILLTLTSALTAQAQSRYERRPESYNNSRSQNSSADAVSLAHRLRSEAVRIVERAASGPGGQREDRILLNKLRSANIRDGGSRCLERARGAAYTPYNGNEIFICPYYATLAQEEGEERAIQVLVHEAAHLCGIRSEEQAEGISLTLMDMGLGRR